MTSIERKHHSPPSSTTPDIGASEAATTAVSPPSCCCCQRRPFLDGNPEAIAWVMDTIATSTAFAGSGAFLITALIKLAKDAAGCETERLEGESKAPECHNTVHGMKPSSLISFYATVIGLAAAVVMPVAGAIVDTTAHRRGIGRLLAAAFCCALFPTIFLNEDNWFAISVVFAVFGFIGWFETMVVYAYLPELTSDEATLNRYTRTFTVLMFATMVVYLGLITGVSFGLGSSDDKDTLDDEIKTSRLSQSVSFGLAVILLSIAWSRLFGVRPPARTLAENESVWTSGFIQLYRTTRKVHRHYPALQWFFVAIAFCDAGTHALLVLAITFTTDQLEFSGAENGAAIVLLLVASIPGACLSSWWTKRYNPVWSTMTAVILLIVNTTLVAAILKGPDQKMGAYLLAAGWGIGTGWKWTVDRMLYAILLPPGQNTEFSGAFIFFRQCLTWVPPLVFTIMNESDISLRWGMASLNIVFILGLLVYYFGVRPRYASAVEDARCGRSSGREDLDNNESTHSSFNENVLEDTHGKVVNSNVGKPESSVL